jgi:hypothetical protein
VEGSYVVTFNDPVGNEKPVIDPPSKTPHGPVPFGEHSTGQSKQALEMALGLNGKGKVNRIFDAINAAHILMDAKEAERLSHHKWVKRVDQDVLFSFATAQSNAGWGLGRIDQATPSYPPNTTYN